MASRLSAALRFGREQVEVDRHSHGEIAGAVGVELVARPAGRAFGHELRLEAAGLRIERCLVEVNHAVEQARRADEFVERLALVILLGEPCAAFEEPSALTTVAPITRICDCRARMRPTTSFMPFCAVSTDALPLRLKSLIPSSQIMAVTPESSSTSRSMPCIADGPPGNGFCGPYSAGPAILLPPMPGLTTALRM